LSKEKKNSFSSFSRLFGLTGKEVIFNGKVVFFLRFPGALLFPPVLLCNKVARFFLVQTYRSDRRNTHE
jgi:hypothetical protein